VKSEKSLFFAVYSEEKMVDAATGYRKHPQLTTTLDWPDIKAIGFWLKNLGLLDEGIIARQ
jgi:hypothetical protein